jgi:hypothetical protein
MGSPLARVRTAARARSPRTRSSRARSTPRRPRCARRTRRARTSPLLARRSLQGVVGIEHLELPEHFLDFPPGVFGRQDRTHAATHGFADSGDELHERLVRDPDRIVRDSCAQERCGLHLLCRKPAVEPVDENVRVNERGHGGTAPRASSRATGRASAGQRTGVPAGAWWPGRTRRAARESTRRDRIGLPRMSLDRAGWTCQPFARRARRPLEHRPGPQRLAES